MGLFSAYFHSGEGGDFFAFLFWGPAETEATFLIFFGSNPTTDIVTEIRFATCCCPLDRMKYLGFDRKDKGKMDNRKEKECDRKGKEDIEKNEETANPRGERQDLG